MSKEFQTVFVGDFSQCKNTVALKERFIPEFYKLEQERIFRKAWLVAASMTDLSQKGSFYISDIPPLKVSLLIVRGEDDQIRAFHNVCRHRGDKLVQTQSGTTRSFTCAFHAWSYSTSGKLLNITDATQFNGINKEEYGLVPVHCQVWEDAVFVCLDDTPQETLEQFLGPEIYHGYKGFSKDRVKIADHKLVLKTNWNLATNAFSEGYHNLYIHKNTVPDYQGGAGNPDRHRPYLEVGRHFGRYSTHGNQNHKKTPTEAAVYAHSKPLFPWFPALDMTNYPPGINPSRFSQWGFDIVHIFPNCIFGPQANSHTFMTFWPIDHENTEIRNWRFAYGTDNPADAIAQAYSVTRAREVIREDMNTMETTLKGINSGAIPHIVLSQQEMLIQNHYRAVDAMIERNKP